MTEAWMLGISIGSLIVSLSALMFPVILHIMQRPKLNLFLDKMSYIDIKTQVKTPFIRLILINEGYRPIIISECKYWTNAGGQGGVGIYDVLKTPHGIAEIVLPVLIEPAKVIMINLVRPDILESIIKISVYDPDVKEYQVCDHVVEDMKRRLAVK